MKYHLKDSHKSQHTSLQKVFLIAFLCIFGMWGTFLFPLGKGFCHTINYSVEPGGMSVRVFYSPDDPASYAEYEVFGPGDTEPYQVGRTDRRGCVSILPDRPGDWRIKVLGESAHGFHGITIEVKVNEAFLVESFSKPLLATHTKLITGVALIFGVFGLYALWKSRKAKRAMEG